MVGPRPFMLDQKNLYDESGGAAYYDLRPGITGLWQVTSRNNSLFCGRVRHDETYAQSLSLMNDIKVIFATAGVVLRSTGH